jgi:hypothetical protein
MPEAKSFTALAALPGCSLKVDVSGFGFWTTASGFNKGTGGTPSRASIEKSLQLVTRLFRNLHAVEVDTFYDTTTLAAHYVTGEENGTANDVIEPEKRACSGSLSSDNVDDLALGRIDLRQESGSVRVYDGEHFRQSNASTNHGG